MGKAWALLLAIGLSVAVLLPIHEDFRGVQGDSFPFSWYPMFSRPRPDPDYSNYVLGLTRSGERIYIPSDYYVRGGMNQARRQLDFLVQKPTTAIQVCEQAAKRVARSSNGRYAEVEKVRVARGWFHMEDYFKNGNKSPVREKTFARCKVVRDEDPVKGEEK